MKKTVFATLLATILLTACGEKIHDLEYYKTHEKERKAQMEKCKSNPGKYKGNGNCVNAFTAQRDLELEARKKEREECGWFGCDSPYSTKKQQNNEQKKE